MRLHAAEMALEEGGEIVATAAAEKSREADKSIGILRQQMGLLIGDHLQPVFDLPQEYVSRRKIVARASVDPTAGGERLERRERIAPAQLRRPAARDQLLRLHEKFDLADAAAAELDVVSLDRDLAMAAKGVDLAFHRLHVGDGGVVEVTPPNERGKLAKKTFTGGDVAGDGTRLDEDGPLPGLARPFVIGQRRVGRDRGLCRSGVGAETKVDAEYISLGRAFLQEPHEVARKLDEKWAGLDAGRERRFRFEQNNEIDIAGIIQLAAAELSHAEHDEARARAGSVRLGQSNLTRRPRFRQQKIRRRRHRRLGD